MYVHQHRGFSFELLGRYMPLHLLPKAGPSIAAITGMGKCCKRVMKALPLNAKVCSLDRRNQKLAV